MGKKEKDSVQNSSPVEQRSSAISRRSFLKGTGVGAAGLAVTRLAVPEAEGQEGLEGLEGQTTVPASGPDPIPMTFQVNGQTVTASLGVCSGYPIMFKIT